MSAPCPAPVATRHSCTGKGSPEPPPSGDTGHGPALHQVWRATVLLQHTTSTSASLDMETRGPGFCLTAMKSFLVHPPGLLRDVGPTWSSACSHHLWLSNAAGDPCATRSASPSAPACQSDTTNHPPALLTLVREVMPGSDESTEERGV